LHLAESPFPIPAGEDGEETRLCNIEGPFFEKVGGLASLLFTRFFKKFYCIPKTYLLKTLDQVMREQHLMAGINGGYFHPDGRPLGLMLSQGKRIHGQESASILSGFVVVTGEEIQILRVGEKMPTQPTGALQTGPFLINHQVSVVGLEATRIARRTFVATDGHGLWMIGVISPITLALAAPVLLAAAPALFPTHGIQRAFNLDGGSSSALWVDLSPEPFSQREVGTVRNFLTLKLKKLQH